MSPRTHGPLVVVGDTLLDIDLEGQAGKIAPDAPVPVLRDVGERPRAGGAGLAADIAANLGDRDVVLVTALADDDAGRTLRDQLDGAQVLALHQGGGTQIKQRLRADGQTLLRIDSGCPGEVTGPVPEELDALLARAAAVLVSDYGRGVAAHPGIAERLAAAASRLPLVWDPHLRGPRPVAGARLVTPNRAEADELFSRCGRAVGGRVGPVTRAHRQAEALVEEWGVHAVAITLGSRGALLSYGSGVPQLIPARAVSGGDVCGAGDSFTAAAALALAAGAVTSEAVAAGVQTAGDFVAGGGASGWQASRTVPQHPTERDGRSVVRAIHNRGGTVVATGGCFDLLHAGHVETLEAARSLGDCLVVCLNSDASVRRLKGPSRPLVDQADRRRVLQSLSCVDAVVVFDEDSPDRVLGELRPDIWVKGGDYSAEQLPEREVLAQWGGQAVTVPYLSGRSTSHLVETARSLTSPDHSSTPPSPGGDA
ncbi:MAG TPA: D-glycero-beta-D-manno-heptose 1-phosphate adenylyltransferase [Marmoricola sp.]|nr:D-glycero-beta-D-manno-heptose 1-phosphate adenylyltransferase [Marmoricola sp.]